jgi:hypothetical protein
MSSRSDDHILFESFLTHLRGRAFSITARQHMRIYELLDQLECGYGPSEIKTILCPLVATNAEQQAEFYEAFDQFYPCFGGTHQPVIDEPGAPQTAATAALRPKGNVRFNRIALVAATILLIVVPASYFAYSNLAPKKEATDKLPTPDFPVERVTNPGRAVSPSWEEAAEPERSGRNRFPWEWVIGGIPMLAWAGIEFFYWRRRRTVLHRASVPQLPRSFPLQLRDLTAPAYASPSFLAAAQRLRARKPGAARSLDIQRTVDKSIRALGYPVLEYATRTETPEYLMLIDRCGPRDQQFRLFMQLAAVLRREGVFVEEYFYDGDPRTCWSAGSYGRYLSLSELQRMYPNHRLLVFGDGDQFLDPITGKPATWSNALDAWRDRALLTPVPLPQWSLRERNLAAALRVIVPATEDSLHVITDQFASGEETEGSLPRRPSLVRSLPEPQWDSSPDRLIDQLQPSLGRDCFVWLCACAVFPELHWALTLHLASLPSLPPNLLTEENIVRLVRLPWFRNGFIPDEVRWSLIRELTPEQEREIRESIISHLEMSEAAGAATVSGDVALQIAAQRYLKDRTAAAWKALRRLLRAKGAEEEAIMDYTFVRTIEDSRKSALDFLLPKKFRALVSDRGTSPIAWRSGARFVTASVFAGVCVSAFVVYQDQTPVPPRMAAMTKTTTSFSIDPKREYPIRVSSQVPIFASIDRRLNAMGESLVINEVVPYGSHEISFNGISYGAAFSIEASLGQSPRISNIRTSNLKMILAAYLNDKVTLWSSSPTTVLVGGKPVELRSVGSAGQQVDRVGQGEVAFPSNPQVVLFKPMSSPGELMTFLYTDGHQGNLEVTLSNVSDGAPMYGAMISIKGDGFMSGRSILRTPTRFQLASGRYRISIDKPGFTPPDEQIVEIRTGETTKAAFSMEPAPLNVEPTSASVHFIAATPGATVLFDGTAIGEVGGDGGFEAQILQFGDHTIELVGSTPGRYSRLAFRRSFVAGQKVVIQDAKLTQLWEDPLKQPRTPQPQAIPQPAGPGAISQLDGAFTREGNFFVLKGPARVMLRSRSALGTISFTLREPGDGKAVRWALGSLDESYGLFTLSHRGLTRYAVAGGVQRRVLDSRLPLPQDVWQVQIDVREQAIIHRVLVNGNWVVVDNWVDPDGKFGSARFSFVIEGRDMLELQDFRFTPATK